MSIIKRRVTRETTVVYVCMLVKLMIAYLGGGVFLSMPAMYDLDNGCIENAYVDLSRSFLLGEKSQNRREKAQEGQQSVQENGQEQDRAIDELTVAELKIMVEQRLALLLSKERRAMLAQHLPEHLYTVLCRVKTQHAQLYQELAPVAAGSFVRLDTPEDSQNGMDQDARVQREKRERELMSIILQELCVRLGQEGQDLDELLKGECMSWVKCYWGVMGVLSFVAIVAACYAPFAPCRP